MLPPKLSVARLTLVAGVLATLLADLAHGAAPANQKAAQPQAPGYPLQVTKVIVGYRFVRGAPTATNAASGTVIYQPAMASSQDGLWRVVARDFSDPRVRELEAKAVLAAAPPPKDPWEPTIKLLPAGAAGSPGKEPTSELKLGTQAVLSGVVGPRQIPTSVELIFYPGEESRVKQLCRDWLKEGRIPSQQMVDTTLGNATVPPLTVEEAKQMQANAYNYLRNTVIPALIANNPAGRAEFNGVMKQFPATRAFADEQIKLAMAQVVDQANRQAQAARQSQAAAVAGQPSVSTGPSARSGTIRTTFTFTTPSCRDCPFRKKK